jgi:ArsR family transcriptional regulator
LWQAVREEISSAPSADQDAQRLASVLQERRSRSAAFFSATAADWEGVRKELYGNRVELLPLLALLEPSLVVGDLGCGTGQVARSLAPFVKRVIGVDASAAMIQAAQARTNGNRNIDLRIGELEQLPISDGELDAALLFLVLHYVVDPARALAEAARVIKPGGSLVITDMLPHDRIDYRETMGHVWQGFAEDQLAAWLSAAGFQNFGFIELTPDPQAKGPLLFAARARRS